METIYYSLMSVILFLALPIQFVLVGEIYKLRAKNDSYEQIPFTTWFLTTPFGLVFPVLFCI